MNVGKMLLQIIVIATSFLWTSKGEFSSLLKTPVEENVRSYNAVRANQMIAGTNGLCIDVQGNIYTDGTPIIVWPCKDLSHPTVQNQLWTFESDGTLRSNGKCITASGFEQGSNIVIHDCSTAERDATIWELQSDGEITNPSSGFVLTGLFGVSGRQMTLQKSISSSFQTWQVGNDTQPILATIIGMNNLCLQILDDAVWIDECDSSNVGQQWLIYPDGTIRPKGSTIDCLGYDDLINSQIVAFTCGHGAASQRWLFTENGDILNERAGWVFDVARSDPSLRMIIVYPVTGKPNQKWELKYLSSSYVI